MIRINLLLAWRLGLELHVEESITVHAAGADLACLKLKRPASVLK